MADLALVGAHDTTLSPSSDRRLVAVGIVRRHAGRTTTVRATLAGVTGSITPTGGAR